MASRTINGRLAIDRHGVRELTGAGLSTITYWNSNRATNGFPDTIPATLTGAAKHNWWWADEIDAFHTRHQTAKTSTLTPVNRAGDPNDLLTGAAAAAVIGYTSPAAIPNELLALADHIQILPSGRKRRHWRRATLTQWADNRTGKSGSGPPPGSRNRADGRNRVIDRTGDDEQLVGAVEAARVLGYVRTRSLPRALYDHADHTETKPSGRVFHKWRRATLWAFNDQPADRPSPPTP